MMTDEGRTDGRTDGRLSIANTAFMHSIARVKRPEAGDIATADVLVII